MWRALAWAMECSFKKNDYQPDDTRSCVTYQR
jgi:hypothetical protein